MGILDAVEQLVGLQAQATLPPYYVNNLLVDGTLSGTWWMEGDTLAIRPFGDIPYDEVESEARRVPGADDVRFESAL